MLTLKQLALYDHQLKPEHQKFLDSQLSQFLSSQSVKFAEQIYNSNITSNDHILDSISIFYRHLQDGKEIKDITDKTDDIYYISYKLSAMIRDKLSSLGSIEPDAQNDSQMVSNLINVFNYAKFRVSFAEQVLRGINDIINELEFTPIALHTQIRDLKGRILQYLDKNDIPFSLLNIFATVKGKDNLSKGNILVRFSILTKTIPNSIATIHTSIPVKLIELDNNSIRDKNKIEKVYESLLHMAADALSN